MSVMWSIERREGGRVNVVNVTKVGPGPGVGLFCPVSLWVDDSPM